MQTADVAYSDSPAVGALAIDGLGGVGSRSTVDSQKNNAAALLTGRD